MSGTLVIVDHRDGRITDHSHEVLAAAVTHGSGDIDAIIVSSDTSLASQITTPGVARVIAVKVSETEPGSCTIRGAVHRVIELRNPSLVFAPFSPNLMASAPAIAAANGLGFASDVIAFASDGDTISATRSYYGGKVEADLEFPGRACTLLMLRGGVWAAAGDGAPVQVEEIAFDDDPDVRHIEYREAESTGVDITTADVLLSVGRGVGDQDAIERFESIAERLGVTLSVSRPLVDAGWISSDRQVGQSGKTVAPKLYIALGISGAVQHLAGMKGSQQIIAVNTDGNAPIFSVADLGSTCDMHDLADELEKLIG